ncbi:MAG: FAD-binding protein [Candidatus Thermoplasmatota archaeon]|nr:FAD-binding protein [Candidatus Thermoplasmatota archaeon]
MHTVDDGATGRPFNANNAGPLAPSSGFSAKEEPVHGEIARALSALRVPGLRVASSAGERKLYSRDQSEIPRFMKDILFSSLPAVVVQASTAEAVVSAIRFASSRGMPVIPRGSGSSPFGGSVPVKGGMVLDVSAMDRVLSVDEASKTAVVEAGARWADIDRELEKVGLTLISCPSSKFSTVGGWVATGGMGLNSLSKGHLSEHVEEVSLVAADGSTMRLSKGDKMFASVFGSEGQLGVITQVRLRVRDRPLKGRPHLVMFGDVADALSFAYALIASPVNPAHIIYENSQKFVLTNRMLGKEHFESSDGIVVSIEGAESEELFQQFLRSVGLKEEKEYLARYMWNERYFPMKLRKFGPGLLGSEVVVDLKLLPDALSKADELAKELGLETLFEVHFLSDGRGLLLCYYLTDQGNTIGYTLDAAKSFVLTSMLIDSGARPYSIGVWNNAFVDAEDRSKLAALREAKASLDPHGVMNAGKMFSLSGRFAGVAGFVFNPKVMRPALKMIRALSPVTVRLIRAADKFAKRRLRPKGRTELLRIADECAMCGACVSVCPAYLIVRDERVTARGKLLTAKAMARGAWITKEHSDRTFLCMKCKACEQVCQSKLDLLSAYDLLEAELERLHGRDAREIEDFIRYAENTPEYDNLIKRGLVLGAPRHGMDEGPAGQQEAGSDGL